MVLKEILKKHVTNFEKLLDDAGFINGVWVKTGSHGHFDVDNPANGEILATLPDMGKEETSAAIQAAFEAQKEWAERTSAERSRLLRKWHDLLIANRDAVAAIMTLEMGKPLLEAKGEVNYAASYIEWFAEEAKRLYGETIPPFSKDKRIIVIRQPVGVVGIITPWNFPAAMLTRKIAPALAVGCSVVAKPAAETPLTAIALVKLAEMAGFPKGLINLVLGTKSAEIGQEICNSEKVRKVSFTGSTNVGRILMRQCSDQIKKMSLELGGNAPFIVFDDADIDKAVEGAIISKFRNAGQTCVCANRLYIQKNVHDEFVKKLGERIASFKVGNGFSENVTIGPLITDKALEKVEEHLKDAMEKGATLVTGGNRLEETGHFFAPTLLTGITSNMKVAREETFGPLAPIFKFNTVEEVIAAANNTEFGLAAYFYSRDYSKIIRVTEALEYGMVGINTGAISTETAPFGGIKQSGIGREGSHFSLDDYTELKYLCVEV